MLYKTVNYYPLSERGPYIDDPKKLDGFTPCDLAEFLTASSKEGWEFSSLAPLSFGIGGSITSFVVVLVMRETSSA